MHDPIHHLYDVYVRINQEAKHDPAIDQQANAYFKRMEQGTHNIEHFMNTIYLCDLS